MGRRRNALRKALANSVASAVYNRRSLLRVSRRIGRANRNRMPSTYKYTQFVTGATISGLGTRTITQAVVPKYNALYFTLNDLSQVANFTGLYDAYRINKIQIIFTPMCNMQTIPGTNVDPGIFATVIDYDDANVLTTLNQNQEYMTYKQSPMISTRAHIRTFKPKVTTAAYSGAFSSYMQSSNQWLDVASPAIQHYGIKVYMDAYASAATAQTYQVTAKYWLEFKSVR